MPSFMPIGLKLWALEGYRQTDRQTDKQTNRQSYFNNIDVHTLKSNSILNNAEVNIRDVSSLPVP